MRQKEAVILISISLFDNNKDESKRDVYLCRINLFKKVTFLL